MASFRPLAFELEAKEICPHPTSLLPPTTVSKNFCLLWQFCPIWQFSTLALYALWQPFWVPEMKQSNRFFWRRPYTSNSLTLVLQQPPTAGLAKKRALIPTGPKTYLSFQTPSMYPFNIYTPEASIFVHKDENDPTFPRPGKSMPKLCATSSSKWSISPHHFIINCECEMALTPHSTIDRFMTYSLRKIALD